MDSPGDGRKTDAGLLQGRMAQKTREDSFFYSNEGGSHRTIARVGMTSQ